MYKPTIKTCLEIQMVKTVQPGDVIHYYWHLQAFNCWPARIFYLEPGEYYVKICFSPFPLKPDNGLQPMDAIRVPFEMVAPESEEIEAYELFLEFLGEWRNDGNAIPPAFLQLDSEYPDARCTKFAYEFLLFRSGRFYGLSKFEKQHLAMLRNQYFTKYRGQLWNPDWNRIREVSRIDSTGNWVPE